MVRGVTVSVSAVSDVGLRRSENQDAVVVGDWVGRGSRASLVQEFALSSGDELVLGVVDGMGGHAGGAAAAALVASELAAVASSAIGETGRALELVSDRVLAAGQAWGTPEMGATVAALVIGVGGVRVFNAGDCRVVRLFGGYVGELTQEDRAPDPRRPGASVVTQSLGGTRRAIEPHEMALEHGDVFVRYLVSSDGLHHEVSEESVAEVLASASSPAEACDRLVALALESGAPDNVSVVVADVVT